MTLVDRHANLRQARERAVGATLQLLTGYSSEYNVSSAELLSLLIEDLQTALHRPASPLSTSARSVASQSSRLYYSIVFRHTCKNQWVCPNSCDLCASNPNKRCEPESDLASKQLEEKEPLKTRCGALLQATVCFHEASQGELPNGAFALDDFNPQDFCIEMSIVSAQSVASLTEAGADLSVEAIRQTCELLTKKNTTHMPLLRKTSNSPEDSDNHRVRADFLPGRDHIGLDVRVTENSQRRLAATQKFQLLLVLLRKTDRQPVGYTLSNAFQVTTARSEVDWNADTPCWDSPVNKLDKCGTEITKNLLNVAECCESKGFVPPLLPLINTVRTVQDFCYLCEDMGTWGPVPHAVISALVPEKTVKHSKKMLPRDYRMRIFMPKDCQHGAMYLCEQAHVDLANSAHGVLLSCVLTRGTIRICLPERRSAEQNTLMSQLARQAEAAWQLPGHPGWYAAKCMEDSETLLDLLRQKEAENGGGLELSWHALADMLSIDARIFQPSMMHGGSPQLARPQGGAHWGLPQTQQQPPQVPAGHLGAQQSPFLGTSNQEFIPSQGQQPPQVLQAWPHSTAGSGYMLPGDTLLPEPVQAGQFAAGPAATAEADPFALPSHVTEDRPSANSNLLGPQGQPTGFGPFFSAQVNIPTQFPGVVAAGPNMPPQGVPVLHSQDISSHAGSISPDEMRYTASASAHLGPVSPADSHLSYQSRSGHAQQSTDSSLALLQQQQQLQHLQQLQLQQQQQPFASMRQDLQPAGQVPVGLGQTPGGPELESVVLSGFPVHRGVREFAHTQSDRVRRKPPSRNPSFNDFRDAKRRSTAPAGLLDDTLLDDTLDHICNDPGGSEDSHLGSGALVAAPQQATFWPMGSNNSHSHSHQRHRGWAAQASPSSFHIDLPGLPSLVFADPVDRPIQQHTWVLPQYDGAGDLSSEDISFLDKDDVMSLFAVPGGLGDDADSEQQATGPDEVEEIQPQVPYVVYVFLAKMRALVVRRRRHQLGAVAESLALDSCRKRMWQRAVIARFAKSGHAHAIGGTRAASMDLSDLVGGSARDLWNEAGHQDDNHFLLDMAAEYFN